MVVKRKSERLADDPLTRAELDFSEEARGRLREAIAAAGGVADVAERGRMSRQGLYKVIGKGATGSIGAIRLHRLAAAVGRSSAWILTGQEGDRPTSPPPEPATFGVPLLDLEVAAGAGRSGWEGWLHRVEADVMPFPIEFLRARFPKLDTLRVVTVRGDSQEPLLHDGDYLMIDTSKTKAFDGLAVVMLDGELLVKQVERAGRIVRLLSQNPRYTPIELDLEEGREFAVIGRAVWKAGVL